MEKLNLYEKIQAVSNDVKNIEKDMNVGQGSYGGYKAVSDNIVTQLVKAAETKHRILSIPIKQEIVSQEKVSSVTKAGKSVLNYVDNIKMTLRIIDLDNTDSFLDIESFGKGLDTGDKGFGKASTYARKYALLNAYKIATGEDLDAKPSEENSPAKANIKPQQTAPALKTLTPLKTALDDIKKSTSLATLKAVQGINEHLWKDASFITAMQAKAKELQ